MIERFLQEKHPRRELLWRTLAYAEFLRILFLTACSQPSPDTSATTISSSQTSFKDGGGIFPEGELITQGFFTQEALRKLIPYFQTFPEVSVIIPRNAYVRVNMQEPSVPRDTADNSKILAITFGENESGNLDIQLDFKGDVFLGKDFKNQYPESPAIVFATKGTTVLSGGADDFNTWTDTGKAEGRLGFMFFRFLVPLEEIFDTELVLIFNKGLLGHQGNSAVTLPIKFKIIPPSMSTT